MVNSFKEIFKYTKCDIWCVCVSDRLKKIIFAWNNWTVILLCACRYHF